MTALLLAALLAAPPPSTPARPLEAVRRAVVSVRVTGQEYDWRAPWSKHSPWSRTCSGIVVDGKAILVAAECVANATLVELQKQGEEERHGARVRLADQEADLALLHAEDAAFFTGLAALPIAAEAPVDGDLTVHRWLASNQFETARAHVRQVRVGSHGYGRVPLLTLDVSSPMQAGGHSEILVQDGQVVGVATSKRDDVMLAIAAPALRQFLTASGRTPYPGFARHGLHWQKLLNPALRDALGMNPGEGGVLINRVQPHGTGANVLQPGDVLLAVDGTPIDVSGQFEHPRYGKQFFALLLSLNHLPGEQLSVKVLRKGARLDLKVPLRRMTPDLDRILPYVVDATPEYLVRGGLVFQHLSVPYLSTFGDIRRRAPLRLAVSAELDADWPTGEAPRLVVLTHVLPDPSNVGYHDAHNLIVERVNGRKVGTLQDVREALDAAPPDGAFHVIDLAPGQGWRRIVLDAHEMASAAERIRTRYGVDSDG